MVYGVCCIWIAVIMLYCVVFSCVHSLAHSLTHSLAHVDYKAKVVGLMDSQEHFSKCTGSETVFALKARLSATVVEKGE
jgi:hypothetical protein